MDLHDNRDPLYVLEALAARARDEDTPRVDVSRDVVRRLRTAQRATDRGLVVLTAGALTAAVVIGIVSIPYFTGALDPLTVLMETTVASLI